jgi:hypothetical protein
MLKYYKLVIGMVLLLSGNLVWGQSHLGVYSGLNFGNLLGDAPEDGYYYSLPGFTGGANFDVSINKILAVSVQPSFSQGGTSVYFKVAGKRELVDSIFIRLNYFSLPLLLKIESTNKHFYAIGGFEAAYLFSYSVYSGDEKLDEDLGISTFDLTAQFGAGYRFFLGLPRLYLELRYAQGIVNLTDRLNEENYIPRVKTSGFKFLVGIEFPLGKPSKQ